MDYKLERNSHYHDGQKYMIKGMKDKLIKINFMI